MRMICAKNFFFIPGYSLIGKGYCEHESGEKPYRCCLDDVSSQILCENHCSSWTSCIAYEYGNADFSILNCCLIPLEKSCPSDFVKEHLPGTIAASMNELRGDSDSNSVCHGKA